jgi:hypothetical protein
VDVDKVAPPILKGFDLLTAGAVPTTGHTAIQGIVPIAAKFPLVEQQRPNSAWNKNTCWGKYCSGSSERG